MEWLFLLFLGGIVGITILYSYWYGITPTPTSASVQKKLISLLPELANCEIAELGSGWGTLAFALARHFPDCVIKSYEISPFPFLISKIIAYYLALPNVSLQRKDFFQIPLNNISLIVCYLYPLAMQQLKSKFEKELSPHAFVITHTFAIPGWKPLRVEHAPDLYQTPIYIYQIKTALNKQHDNIDSIKP